MPGIITFVYKVDVDNCEEFDCHRNWTAAIFLPNQLEEAKAFADREAIAREQCGEYVGNEVTIYHFPLPYGKGEKIVYQVNRATEANKIVKDISAKVEKDIEPELKRLAERQEELKQQRSREKLRELGLIVVDEE